MLCVDCGQVLNSAADTFGDVGQERCWSCWWQEQDRRPTWLRQVLGPESRRLTPAHERLLLALSHSDTTRRDPAVLALEGGHDPASTFLVRRLVRRWPWRDGVVAAARSLAASRHPTAAPFVWLALERVRREWPKPDPEHLWEDALRLVGHNPQRLLPWLIRRSRHPDPVRRIISVIVLGEVADRSAGERLVDALERDPDPSVRVQAAWSLGNFVGLDGLSSAEITRALGAAGPAPEADLRRAALESLVYWNETEARALASVLTQDEVQAVRDTAARCLELIAVRERARAYVVADDEDEDDPAPEFWDEPPFWEPAALNETSET